MNENNKILLKSSLILSIGQFVPKIIAIITLPILTKYFSIEDFGIYDLIISIASLVIPIITLLVQQAIFRNLIDTEDKQKIKEYITNGLIVIVTVSSIFFIVTLLMNKYVTIDFNIILLACGVYFTEALYDFLGQVARGLSDNFSFSFAVVVYSVTNMILLLLTTFFKNVNLYIALLFIIISYVLAIIFLIVKTKIKKYIKISELSWDAVKKLLKYSIPIIPSSVSLWITNLSDRFLITIFLGNSLNGIYAAASKIPNLLGMGIGIFNLAWTETASKTIKKENINKYYSNLFNQLLCFLFGGMFLIIAFSRVIFNILIDSKFNDGILQMPILIFSVLLNGIITFYSGLYVSLKKTNQVGISSFAGAIINIIINIIFIKKIGLYAASISTVIAYLVIILYRGIDLQKYIKINYSQKNILISFFIFLIIMLNFYNSNIYTFILNICITFAYNIVFNKRIFEIIKKIKEEKNV